MAPQEGNPDARGEGLPYWVSYGAQTLPSTKHTQEHVPAGRDGRSCPSRWGRKVREGHQCCSRKTRFNFSTHIPHLPIYVNLSIPLLWESLENPRQ